MISLKEALDIVDKNVIQIADLEQVALYESLDKVLAKDVFSDIDMPPFDKSAMDGYACKMNDIHTPLTLIGTIRAGDDQSISVENGECVKIMTGGRMPANADCVVMVEETKLENDKIIFTGTHTKPNFVEQAHDICNGDKVLSAHDLIKPQHIAVMASVGMLKPIVFKQLRVAVLTTGDEIVEPHMVPVGTQIRNSNASQLLAQIRRLGALPMYLGIVADDKAITEQAISEALQLADVLLITGGVSMGEYDHVPEILLKLGVDIKFDKVAVKPGKPTTFGVAESCYVLGLPGNPVSSYIIFEIFAKKLIHKLMGIQSPEVEIQTSIAIDYTRRSTSRTDWVPIIVNSDGTVSPVVYHGSAHIHALCAANGIMKVETGIKSISKGEKVNVRLI